jgi:hypothetical protein
MMFRVTFISTWRSSTLSLAWRGVMVFPTDSPDIIGLSAFGIVLVLLGLAWLLAGSLLEARGQRWFLVGLACLCGLGAGGLCFLDASPFLWQPLLALSAVWLVLAVASADLLARTARALARLAGRPMAQALVLLAGGLAVTGSQLWQLDKDLERELNRTDAELTLLTEPPEMETTPRRIARTDAGHLIPLFAPRAESLCSIEVDSEQRYLHNLQLERKLIQTGDTDENYNCHGWVFTAGRYWVRGAFVKRILKDNGYTVAPQVRPGDLAVFSNDSGEVTHTGLVHSVGSKGVVLVESKWGRMGRYIHTAEEHGYRGSQVVYYRTKRGSHLLQGLDEATPPTIRSGI